ENGRTGAAELLRQLGDGGVLLSVRHAGLPSRVVPPGRARTKRRAPAQGTGLGGAHAWRGSRIVACAGRPLSAEPSATPASRCGNRRSVVVDNDRGRRPAGQNGSGGPDGSARGRGTGTGGTAALARCLRRLQCAHLVLRWGLD